MYTTLHSCLYSWIGKLIENNKPNLFKIRDLNIKFYLYLTFIWLIEYLESLHTAFKDVQYIWTELQ